MWKATHKRKQALLYLSTTMSNRQTNRHFQGSRVGSIGSSSSRDRSGNVISCTIHSIPLITQSWPGSTSPEKPQLLHIPEPPCSRCTFSRQNTMHINHCHCFVAHRFQGFQVSFFFSSQVCLPTESVPFYSREKALKSEQLSKVVNHVSVLNLGLVVWFCWRCLLLSLVLGGLEQKGLQKLLPPQKKQKPWWPHYQFYLPLQRRILASPE